MKERRVNKKKKLAPKQLPSRPSRLSGCGSWLFAWAYRRNGGRPAEVLSPRWPYRLTIDSENEKKRVKKKTLLRWRYCVCYQSSSFPEICFGEQGYLIFIYSNRVLVYLNTIIMYVFAMLSRCELKIIIDSLRGLLVDVINRELFGSMRHA